MREEYRMKLYIAGPMTGYPDYNRPAFFAAEEALVQAGFEVLNPAHNQLGEGEATWLDYMRMSLRQIADSDGIAKLEGWEKSRGAQIEVNLALSLGLTVATAEDWPMLRWHLPND